MFDKLSLHFPSKIWKHGSIQWVLGESTLGTSHLASRWIFLRILGVIYLVAFLSLEDQLNGLIGSRGILPAHEFLAAVSRVFGPERFRLFPTIFWWNSSDTFLQIACYGGIALSLALIVGIAPLFCLIFLWILYLSFTVVGQAFFSFQWDVLLLEVGFLTIFFAPLNPYPRFSRETAISPLMLLLLWWVLFRLILESGIVKLTSGDNTWRDLSALRYHYETQPLPTWIGWYMHQLPFSFQKISTFFTLACELLAPLLLFGPRRFKLTGCSAIVLLQLLIMLTGNYTFFNLLTIALCLLIPDHRFWKSMLPRRWLVSESSAVSSRSMLPIPYGMLLVVVSFLVLIISSVTLAQTIFPNLPIPGQINRLISWVEPFRSINSYGLFRVMTTRRMELLIDGSNDGQNWQTYEFGWKPGNLSQRPEFVEPFQPRLDWQMWFAALGGYEQDWFTRFLLQLMRGSPPVLALLARNPFPDRPPQYLRVLQYEYHFTNFKTRAKTGQWWWREPKRVIYPPMALAKGENVVDAP